MLQLNVLWCIAQARDTFVLLRNERTKTHAHESYSDLQSQRSSHAEAAPVNQHVSTDDDVIHSFSVCFRLKYIFSRLSACLQVYTSPVNSFFHVIVAIRYDTICKYLTCNPKTDGKPAQSTTRDHKLKRNNDKKIKQTDEHNKSEKRSKSEKAPKVYDGNVQGRSTQLHSD